jgi:hypothetical protein
MIPFDPMITMNSKSGNKKIGSKGENDWQKNGDWRKGSDFVAATAILIAMLLALRTSDHARLVRCFNFSLSLRSDTHLQDDLAMTNGQEPMKMKGETSGRAFLMIFLQPLSLPSLVMKHTNAVSR